MARRASASRRKTRCAASMSPFGVGDLLSDFAVPFTDVSIVLLRQLQNPEEMEEIHANQLLGVWGEARESSNFSPSGTAGCWQGSAMGQQVDIGPTGQIKRGPGGQKIKTRLCQMYAIMAFQHHVQTGFEFMKEEHVIGSVFLLLT